MSLMDSEKCEEFGRSLQSITGGSWQLLRIGGSFAQVSLGARFSADELSIWKHIFCFR